jgi:hypothetical protein
MTDDDREKVSKKSVNYRPKSGKQHCGNCVMYHHSGTCDLVKGEIHADYVCDKWQAD